MAVRILTWNCRGIVNSIRQNALIEIIRQERPKIVFLSETMCDDAQHEVLRLRIGFDHCLSKPVGEGCRGLALLWLEETPVRIHNYSTRHISAFIGSSGAADEWRFTGFYGFPKPEHHSLSWDLLRLLYNQSPLPWLVSGDFNAITTQAEKMGRNPKPWQQILDFRRALQDCDLVDMGFEGNRFTWSGQNVKEWLDRTVWTAELRGLFPESRTIHLPLHGSDHRALLVDICKNPSDTRTLGPKQFRFENMWTAHEEYAGVIEKAWHTPLDGSFVEQFVQRTKNVAKALMEWNRNTFNFLRTERKVIRAKLDALLAAPYDPNYNTEKKELDEKLQVLMTMEEKRWSQRSRELWLKEGDKNTSFFHRKASNRKHRSHISKLKNSQGVEVNTMEGIQQVVTDYFDSIFTAGNQNNQALNIILNSLTPRVTADMNERLLQPYSDAEIKEALFLMHAAKSPGPDGMPPCFYQKGWDTLGADVCNTVRQMLTEHHLMAAVNFTHVTLIPKVKDPKDMGDLRPIALCNVMYRIASKVLANRLKVILHDIISPLQSAFVPGRLISDNTLVATEVAHQMHVNRLAGEGHFALNLDISKAYDRLEWNFIEQVLLKVGFAVEWVTMIMSTLTTVRYSYLINGEVRGYVAPTRGIRQGDPLSPYLFILCAEGLSALISSYVDAGLLKGLKLGPTAPVLHHLLFADDSYLFGGANINECQHVRNILYTYELASGQQVNLKKSSVVFSHKVPQGQRRQLAGTLGVKQVHIHDRYLGLLTRVGRKKSATFDYLRDMLTKKLVGWRSKLLSGAGKEVLIKAVAQSVPNYTMNCYLLPNNLIIDLHQLCAEFWWGDTVDKTKIHWKKWDRLCVLKDQGGLGFKHLLWHNLAMLSKQGWRFINNPNTLAAQLYKAIYYPETDFMHASLGHQPSFYWRSLHTAKNVLKHGSCWKVGDGNNIKIWEDNWIPGKYARSPMLPVTPGAPLMVSNLIDESTRSWKTETLEQYFLPHDVECIKNIKLLLAGQPDRIHWNTNKKEKMSTQATYEVARDRILGYDTEGEIPSNQFRPLWNAIWKAKVPPRVALVNWRACSNILPVRTRLANKGYTGTQECLFCSGVPETTNHLFVECPRMVSACREAHIQILPITGAVSFALWMSFQCVALAKPQRDKLMMLIWSMWRQRNSQLFEGKCLHPAEMAILSGTWLAEYQKNNPYPKPRKSRGWRKPSPGTLKCNVAGVLNSHTHTGGLGIVFRDDLGNFKEAHSITFPQVLSRLQAETLALVKAMHVATMHVHGPMEFETNSHELLQLLQSDGSRNPTVEEHITTIREKMASNVFSVTFVPRLGNKVAFKLALEGLTSFSSDSWCNHAPFFIRDALLNDCNRF